MIHYSCDRCKRSLDPENDLRYVVRMEVQAAMDPLDDDDDDGQRDHLLEIQEILERLEDGDGDLGEDVYHRRRYDLCSECYRQFVANPLAREVSTLGFSKN